ncbi:MAG TPA: response regulator transcription factor [Candidatus Acidoferrum sp.]|nr:response regulator transcription factor [Candidatus Acidoferrum sp.]
MSTATRRSLQIEERLRAPIRSSGNGLARLNGPASSHGNGHASAPANGHANGAGAANGANGNAASRELPKPRVFVAAQNRLLREALSRMLTKNGDIEVVINDAAELFAKPVQHPAHECAQRDDRHAASAPAIAVSPSFHDAEILLLSSKGNLDQDLAAIRKIRSASPELHILLIDVSGDEINFLQCIRAGVRGYLPRDASAEDVVDAVKAIHAGKAVCPGALCTALFRYVEREANCFPSASVHQRLGLTRREQQLIPLVAEGLTNKEIANRFCLSEQTVKNHLYRMKQKIGAEDRLDIVQVCRIQGFMV